MSSENRCELFQHPSFKQFALRNQRCSLSKTSLILEGFLLETWKRFGLDLIEGPSLQKLGEHGCHLVDEWGFDFVRIDFNHSISFNRLNRI